VFSELAGYMTAYCHTKLGKLRVFGQKKFDTRPKFFEKLIWQMNLMVKWCLGKKGAAIVVVGK
jgi:hypothetical protein